MSMDGLRNKISSLIGIDENNLQETAESLYHATEKNPIVYWLYLFVSAGIAYFGLIMNSTAVVIGAMLVSPLMTPLVQTGMAFAAGNMYLAVKALIRVIMSVVVVTIIAAVTTIILPFQEITTEILARTEPTALDLFVALLCAFIASLASARKAGDAVTAAAGTAISIALVPPVCVMGFGLGILDMKIFIGAALLFVANLAAIILVSDLFFIITGFSNVDEVLLEENVIGEKDKKSSLYKIIKSKAFGEKSIKRWAKLRIYLPVLFVAIIALPLSIALSRVAWEVNTKKNINKVLFEFEKKYKIVNRQQKLADKQAALRITIVGDPRKKDQITSELDTSLGIVLGSKPSLSVDIIPSNEYVGERFKLETDLLNTKFIPFLNQAPPIQQTLKPLQPEKLTFINYQDEIKNTLTEVINWINDRSSGPECYAWSYNIGSGWVELVLWRVSDVALSDNEKTLISSYVKRLTDTPVAVSENRYPKTIFVSSKPLLINQIDRIAGKILNGISKENKIGLDVYMRDATKPSANKVKRSYKQMNETIFDLLRKKLPEERIITHQNSDQWKISLFVVGKNDVSQVK
jgi:uncharacterized hydrophobic protein (TIGR00271 family)